MIYILTFNHTQLQYDPQKVHQMVITHLSVDDWWHYLPNVYLISTRVSVSGISNTINSFFPGLLHFVSKVDLNQTSGLLPKEAWEWINKKNLNKGMIKILSKTQGRSLPPITGSSILDNLLKDINK